MESAVCLCDVVEMMSRCVACVFLGLLVGVSAEKANPITRVANLLEGLSKKVVEDGKGEEELFEKYKCWYKTVVGEKTASNAAAADRIEALTAYIDDVESGRVEFTSERGDLTAQLAALNAELEKKMAGTMQGGGKTSVAKPTYDERYRPK